MGYIPAQQKIYPLKTQATKYPKYKFTKPTIQPPILSFTNIQNKIYSLGHINVEVLEKFKRIILKLHTGQAMEGSHFEVCERCNMLFTEMKYNGNHNSYPPSTSLKNGMCLNMAEFHVSNLHIHYGNEHLVKIQVF